MKRAPEQNVGGIISLPACNLSLKVSIKVFPNSVIHKVTLLLTKLCTHIVEELDSNSIILASLPNMGFYIARFVILLLLLTKLCTHIVGELDSNSIILASQPNMSFYIACFVMLQYFTLTFLCLMLVSRKFLIKKIEQQASMLLELMSTLSILSMAFPSLPTCLVATSLWIDILLLFHQLNGI